MALAGLNRVIAALVIGAVATAPAMAADVRPGQSTVSLSSAQGVAAVSRAATRTREKSSLVGVPLILLLVGITVAVTIGVVVASDDDPSSPQ